MFWQKKKLKKSFDRERKKPIIRCSICTGEQVAGFRDLQTGRFEEIQLLQSEKDLKEFLETYDIEEREISREY